MNLDPLVATRAMEILAKQCDELEDRNRDLDSAGNVLATALEDIRQIALDCADYDTTALNRILHICNTGGVRAARALLDSQETP